MGEHKLFTIRYHQGTNARVYAHSYKYAHILTLHLPINKHTPTHAHTCRNTLTYAYAQTHTRIYARIHTYPQHAQMLIHTFTLYNSSYICKYAQIHITIHRRRLTNTCAHAHSETHARNTHPYIH